MRGDGEVERRKEGGDGDGEVVRWKKVVREEEGGDGDGGVMGMVEKGGKEG